MNTESRVELKPLDEERAADFVNDIKMVAVQIDPVIAHALYDYDVAKVALHFDEDVAQWVVLTAPSPVTSSTMATRKKKPTAKTEDAETVDDGSVPEPETESHHVVAARQKQRMHIVSFKQMVIRALSPAQVNVLQEHLGEENLTKPSLMTIFMGIETRFLKQNLAAVDKLFMELITVQWNEMERVEETLGRFRMARNRLQEASEESLPNYLVVKYLRTAFARLAMLPQVTQAFLASTPEKKRQTPEKFAEILMQHSANPDALTVVQDHNARFKKMEETIVMQNQQLKSLKVPAVSPQPVITRAPLSCAECKTAGRLDKGHTWSSCFMNPASPTYGWTKEDPRFVEWLQTRRLSRRKK